MEPSDLIVHLLFEPPSLRDVNSLVDVFLILMRRTFTRAP